MATPGIDHHVTFRGFDPARNAPTGEYLAATPGEVKAAGDWAWEAFRTRPNAEIRAASLESAATGLDRAANELVAIVGTETALPEARVRGELARTTFTLRMFASAIREGSWVECVIDHGDPSRTPFPRPDLRRMLFPIGPVAVFGASNFPLAYGVAGGDTASAWASGCPVVVKGHASHPGTGALVARVLSEAVRASGLHRGWFQYLPAGGTRDVEVGIELVKHDRVRAVGFTGSVSGGTALCHVANERREPIPVFAEMGSVNPVFVLPGAAGTKGREIAAMLAASATNSGGQMCTCPGLIFVCEPAGSFIAQLGAAFASAPKVTMLGPRVASGFHKRVREVSAARGVRPVAGASTPETGITATATLLEVTIRDSLASPTLLEECFGPCTIVVRCDNPDDFLRAAAVLEGSLTATIHADMTDEARAKVLLAALSDRAGRIIVNGVPTGVEVASAMVHSGPFPACSRPDSTAVGSLAMRRWCRPVCFQNVPDELLPEELRDGNPRGIGRVVDGTWRPPNR